MTAFAPEAKKPSSGGLGSITLSSVVLRLIALMIFWAGGAWLMLNMWADGYWQLAGICLFITLLVTIIWLRPEAYPLRWMSPGLSIMILISVYPILYTVYISFTNYGTGHLLPKVQTVDVLEQRKFLPEAGSTYEFILYQNPYGEYALLLQPEAAPTPNLSRLCPETPYRYQTRMQSRRRANRPKASPLWVRMNRTHSYPKINYWLQ
ncbi:MAG: hypothetical protein R3C44_18770 [Chloroflexota bacterium]